MKKIRKCTRCAAYTLFEEHCGATTLLGHPAPYNIRDPYARIRRKIKGIE